MVKSERLNAMSFLSIIYVFILKAVILLNEECEQGFSKKCL